jgi:hypothetical protein
VRDWTLVHDDVEVSDDAPSGQVRTSRTGITKEAESGDLEASV